MNTFSEIVQSILNVGAIALLPIMILVLRIFFRVLS